jgi:MFS family permease
MTFFSAYLAWAVAALFYCYQYILRALPGGIEPNLRADFHLTAHEFGTIGSFTIYAYAFMQIPMGILVDRLGVKKVLTGSIILCLLGAFAMALAQDLTSLQISRILIGMGSASAFMSALKIAADYLPAGKRGFLMGATLTLGTLGAMATGSYLVPLVQSAGWRSVTNSLGFLGFAVTLLAIIGIHLKTSGSRKVSFDWRDITKIIKNRQIMIYALLAVGLYTPLSVLADLWGTAFLMKKYELAQATAASSSGMLFAGLCAGSLILPWLCEKYDCLDIAIQVCSFGILFLFGFLLLGPELEMTSLRLVLVAVGFFCGAEMMCFTGAVQATTAQNSGLTLGVVNTLNMLGGAVLQHIIGYILDFQWKGLVDPSGVRLYDTEQFVVALSLLWAVVAVCCLLSLSLKGRVFNGR